MNERTDLMHCRDERGGVRRVMSIADWLKRRAQILAAMQEVMGPLPGPERRAPLDVQVHEETDACTHIRRRISFLPEPSAPRVPAFLLVPKAIHGKLPAMLTLHQSTRIGKAEPVGLGGIPDLHYAKELADRGHVCLAPDYPMYGEYPWQAGDLGYASTTMKAIWDNIRAVDLLQALPFVDGERIGCIGHSRGGHNSIFTAALEPRLRVIVSCCGFCAFRWYMKGDLTGWSGPAYMPRIKERYQCDPARMPFEFDEVIGALAPRAFLAVAPVRDGNFALEGVREAMANAAPVYRLYGAEQNLQALYPDAGHAFPAASREQAYGFIDQHFTAATE